MKKNNTKKLKIFLYILGISFIGLSITYALNTYNTGYKIYEENDNSGKNYEIIDDLPEYYEGEKKCIKVINNMNSSSTKAFFSPTKTKTEWDNFKSWCNGTSDCDIKYLDTSNLIRNGSFEEHDDNDYSEIDYWDEGSKNWSRSTSIQHSNNNSCNGSELKPDGCFYAFTRGSGDPFYQDIDISNFDNGSNFILRFYSGFNDCDGSSTDNKIYLKFLNSAKFVISSSSYQITDLVHPDDDGDYTLEKGSLKITNKPSSAKYIRVEIEAGSDCDAKVDKMELKLDLDGKCGTSESEYDNNYDPNE